MKLLVTRTSALTDDEMPVEGAERTMIRRYRYRNPIVKEYPGLWETFNRQCTDIIELPDGRFRGTYVVPDEAWVIDVNIFELVKQVGACIVHPTENAEGYPEVEIYDTYRE